MSHRFLTYACHAWVCVRARLLLWDNNTTYRADVRSLVILSMSIPIITRVNNALNFDMTRAHDLAYVACVSQQLEELFDELEELVDDNDDPTLILAQRAVSLAFTFIETTDALPGNIERFSD